MVRLRFLCTMNAHYFEGGLYHKVYCNDSLIYTIKFQLLQTLKLFASSECLLVNSSIIKSDLEVRVYVQLLEVQHHILVLTAVSISQHCVVNEKCWKTRLKCAFVRLIQPHHFPYSLSQSRCQVQYIYFYVQECHYQCVTLSLTSYQRPFISNLSLTVNSAAPHYHAIHSSLHFC